MHSEQPWIRPFITAAIAAVYVVGPSSVRADLFVPASAILSVDGGTINLACTDLVVAGTVQVATGNISNVRNLAIMPGGVVEGGSGLITVGGDWTNNGQFVAGTGTVRFLDLCSLTSATVTGSTTFFNARFVSAIGKTYQFAVGSTQTIAGVLEITGTAAQPIQFRSTMAGQVASINLLPSGVQQILHVGVSDVWATGQYFSPNQSNEGGTGNARRFLGFPNGIIAPIPATDPTIVVLLAMLLAVTGAWGMRRLPLFARRPRTRRAAQLEPADD